MSGRSAHVRKKITETKAGEKNEVRNRARSTTSSEDNVTISDFPMPMRQDTGIGTTNARFLKFSETIHETDALSYQNENYGFVNSSGSQSGGSIDGRREMGSAAGQYHRPLEDFAYARARRPNIRTEDVSGIEKSGLRNAMDKKSEGVRRGLAKAFAFGKKNKHDDDSKSSGTRPPSVATVRPTADSAAGSSGGGYPSDVDLSHEPTVTDHQLHIPQQYPSPVADQTPWDMSGNLMSPPPSAKLPPIPQGGPSAPPIKRWIGAGRPVQRWNKLRKDPELWDPNGDVLVFFGQKSQYPRPNPSFRLSSHIIEATESRVLLTMLREGSTEEDIQLPPSPEGAPPMLQRHMAGGAGYHQGHHLGPHGHGAYGMGQPTPPISEDASLAEADGQISYEMYFPAPPQLNRVDQLRHHITTRNVFALLYHASLVGLSLFQALSDLHARLESYMPPETDNVGTLINYLAARGIDDVRNDPEGAVSILAWSESSDVRWEEGWRESFLHCAGMYSGLELCADFKSVTPITRAMLERASLETQLRVQAAEERLADFQYADMWPPTITTMASSSGPVTVNPTKAASDRLQKFLVAYYARVYGRWPPLPVPTSPTVAMGGDPEDQIWLTRTVAQGLQRDFAALYDYLVDRDIIWDGSEARSGRKWMLVSESGNKAFEADTLDLPMTDMLVEFDNRLRFPHIPHPYPLIPDSIPPNVATTGKDKKDKAKNATSNAGSRAGAVERRVQLAYTVATNMLILGSDFTQSDLIDAFTKFEKMDCCGEVDPMVARRGRWVLIYGILQTLASVSVDALNVRYKDDVAYHMSPRLKGAKMPPWRSTSPSSGGNLLGDEAAHEMSHCWLVPRTWNATSSGNESSTASSTGSGNNSPVRRSGSLLGGSSDHSGGHAFNRQPTSNSNTGYHTPSGARSKRSSMSMGGGHHLSNYLPQPPFAPMGSYPASSYGAPSIVSSNSMYSESSSTRPPTSSSTRRSRSSKATRNYGGAGPNMNAGMGIPPVEEVDWPERAIGQAASLRSQHAMNDSHAVDDPLDDTRSFATAPTSRERVKAKDLEPRYRRDRPLLSRDVDDTESVTPVIRDFDALDLIDDDNIP